MIRFASFLLALSFGAILAAGLKAEDIKPIVNPPIKDETLDVGENSSTASLVGQFRTTASSWLWLRADLYLHNGVEMRPESEEEIKRGVAIDKARDDGEEKLHIENEVTAVPGKDRDFRGMFGDIERQVASFKDMQGHSHNDPKVAMPLYRLMTWIDPQFVQGWTMGGMILARDHSADGTQRALSFLEEGWKANPGSVDLPSQIGSTIISRSGDLQHAVKYLEAARELGRSHKNELMEQEREGLRTTYHFLTFCYRDLGRIADERAILKEGIQIFPDDPLLPRLLVRSIASGT